MKQRVDKLHPEQQRASCKAMKGLFKSLSKDTNNIDITGELFIPCTDGQLHLSSEVVIENNSWLQRIKDFNLLIFVDGYHFGYEIQKIV